MRQALQIAEAKNRAQLSEDDRHRDDNKRRDRQRDQNDQALDDLASLAVATAQQRANFAVTLDRYDAATVEALMESGERLTTLRQRPEDTIAQAHQLPDGRVVFSNEAGTKVFDLDGNQVPSNIITAEEIDPDNPTWERYLSEKNDLREVEQHHQDLLDFQTRLDDARNRLDDNDLTADALDDLDADLAGSMPDILKVRLGIASDAGIDPTAPGQSQPSATAPAAPTTFQP